jgi:hypothetical protein
MNEPEIRKIINANIEYLENEMANSNDDHAIKYVLKDLKKIRGLL